MLSTIVEDATLDNERYIQVRSMNLYNHINIVKKLETPAHSTQDEQIARTFEYIHNELSLAIFDRDKSIPPWRIDILPLESSESNSRVLIAFTYSHCIGDGMSGPNFHRTFLAAMNEKNAAAAEARFDVRKADLPLLPHLPVSLSFLLAPALGHYLPKFISNFFGLKASASGSDEGTWVGARHFDDRLSPDRPINTVVEIFSLDSQTLSQVLEACRSQQTTLTPLLNELIALCMSLKLPKYCAPFGERNNLISCIPTNIRAVADIPKESIGNFAGATYSRHHIKAAQEIKTWQRARVQGVHIAKSVTNLNNQVVGLLAWISNMKTWMGGQLGHTRDASWQLSNLMAFDGGQKAITIEKMYFCQPADVVGQPIDFNTVSVKGGDLVICAVWQPGSLGLDGSDERGVEENERELVVEILQDLKSRLRLIAES